MKEYRIDLYQSHWVRTKTESFVVQAHSEKEAEGLAKGIANDKGLKKDFEFEIEDITPVEDQQLETVAEDPAAPEPDPR